MKRDEKGVFFVTPTRFILTETMKGRIVSEFEVPDEELANGKTFTEGLAIVFSISTFATVLAKTPKGYPAKDEKELEFQYKVSLDGGRFWILTSSCDETDDEIDSKFVHGKLKELRRHLKRRFVGEGV